MPEIREDRIVYCREVDPDTILHLSALGEAYVFRRFDGSDPFDVASKPGHAEMRVCYRFPLDRPLDDAETRHPASDDEWWSEHIAELNRETLGDLRGR
jgi:hypothetical protein